MAKFATNASGAIWWPNLSVRCASGNVSLLKAPSDQIRLLIPSANLQPVKMWMSAKKEPQTLHFYSAPVTGLMSQLSVTLNGRHLKLPDIKAGARGEQTWSGKGSVIKCVIALLVDCKEKHQQYTWFKPKPNDIVIMPRSYMWKISVPGLKRKERRKTNFYTLVSDWSCAGFQLGLSWVALSHHHQLAVHSPRAT